MANDFQGICCSHISLILSSSSFSDGGGFIQCAIHPGPGFISGVFSISHGTGKDEFFKKIDTTYNNWHTLYLEINQANYIVSCYIDGNLIGTTIPKDATALKDSSYQRYLQAGWAENSSVSFQLDDVRMNP